MSHVMEKLLPRGEFNVNFDFTNIRSSFSSRDMDSTSLNTLKSLTNAHAIRDIATLTDVERFPKGHLLRYREFIVLSTVV